MQDFMERIRETPVVFDGAMGTMIYERGVFINTCYDELCLSDAALIAGIHRDYVMAGADVIETNSFGANRVKLTGYGLGDKVEEICRMSVRIAREAAGDHCYVAGSVGPCLKIGQPLKKDRAEAVKAAFEEQIGALTDEGVDLLLLETFGSMDELTLAAEAAAATGVPVIATVTVDDEGETALGVPIERCLERLNDDPHVDVVGVNCGVGPAATYETVERARGATDKPFIVQPNAGMPREVDGRMMYLTSPEYFTEYAKRFIELGVDGVGGCCGTTPEHIRVAAKSVKTMTGVKRHIEIVARAAADAPEEATPLEEKSRLGYKLANGQKVTSIELLPPKTSDLSPLLERARLCYYRGVDTINIPDGPRASPRVSPMVAATAIKNEVVIMNAGCPPRGL